VHCTEQLWSDGIINSSERYDKTLHSIVYLSLKVHTNTTRFSSLILDCVTLHNSNVFLVCSLTKKTNFTQIVKGIDHSKNTTFYVKWTVVIIFDPFVAASEMVLCCSIPSSQMALL
jgi:hypothetical protein